jgi:DNA-binding CsgD family transcriptional regulator
VDDAAGLASGRGPGLVGREAERQRIDAFVAGVPGGVRGLTLRGEAGIGKTSLWLDAVDACRRAGHDVLVARPAAEEMRLALGALVDLFERAGLDAAALRADDADPLARGRAVLATLRRLAGERPVVVAIDDVQWLDAASARALRFALRRLDAEPVGLLCAARPGDGDPVARVLDPARVETVEVGPLGLGALRRVLAGTVDTISRPALRRIHEASGGNPLYAIELARAGAVVPLPDSLQGAIALRLDAAPAELAPLLETVAALGAAPVAALRESFGDALDELLALAAAEDLLAVDEALAVRFAHPLLATAVYGRAGPLARRALHARLAGRADDPDDRARHLALSTDEPDADVAALLADAAGRALRRGAPDVAADYAGHAVRLTPPGEPEARRLRSLVHVESLAAAGEVRRALALADELVASLPAGPGRADALVLRADLEDDDRETAEALLLGALDDAGGDGRVRGRVLDRLAQLRRLRIGDVPGAIACAREALELAEQAGDAPLEAHAAAYLGHLEALAGSPRPELMARAVALEERCGSLALAPPPRILLAKQRLWGGDLAGARALHEEARASAARAGNESQRPQRHYDLALVECAAGNLAAADELARAGIDAARDAENTYAERELLHPLALAQALLGRAGEARATLARLDDEAERHGVRPLRARVLGVRGLLALSEGSADEAAAALAEAAELLEEMGFRHPGAFAVLPDAVEALGGEPAGRLLERLARQAGSVGAPWPRAALDRARGIALAAGGRPGDGAAILLEAADAFDGLGYGVDAARSLLARGRALLRGGHRTVAADALAEARSRFAAMGAALWEARAAEELERAAPGRAAGELTPAERRIAALVAQGLRNREIGQALLMSVGSVEAHLTRIYRKLDVRSRSALASRVADGTIRLPGAE